MNEPLSYRLQGSIKETIYINKNIYQNLERVVSQLINLTLKVPTIDNHDKFAQ